jgi:putative phosphoribosyl transferase
VVLVDDGIATGGTVRAAIKALRAKHPSRIVLAAPVAARETLDALVNEVDDVAVLTAPEQLDGIGRWYDEFGQVDDDEVLASLARVRAVTKAAAPAASARGQGAALEESEVWVESEGVVLAGDLVVPAGASGLVVFAHGSGSSRRSVRNRAVAAQLREAGCGTLLFDLLTEAEEEEDRDTGQLRFDIPLLARRLVGAMTWVHRRRDVGHLPLGLFGSSTGAAAALIAAALHPELVRAVVSRGGRPDLAGTALTSVRAPTLLIVGGADDEVLALNQEALRMLRCEKQLLVVPGATHLFEERGALSQVARHAAHWFAHHFVAVAAAETAAPEGP